jgi:hypothetical protein
LASFSRSRKTHHKKPLDSFIQGFSFASRANLDVPLFAFDAAGFFVDLLSH